MSEKRELVIRRIVVAVDASPHSLAALEAAAELAARFRAELLGLFVEDVNLLRLAELPFTREVGLFSAGGRRLNARQIECQLRVQARRARHTFTTVAERTAVQGNFRVTRGAVAPELLTAASDADLIILGKVGWSLVRRGRLGSTARAMAAGAPALTLILQDGACLGPPVFVAYDGSARSDRALLAAAVLAEQLDGPLTVLLLGDREPAVHRLQEHATRWLGERQIGVEFRPLTESNAHRLAHLAQTAGCRTLVLPAESALLCDEALLALLEQTDIPVLLAR